MKKYIIFSLLIIGSLSVSCEEWFDVTGSSEIREKDHYSTERGFQQTLIGCYIGMTDTHLYGRNLSWLLIERTYLGAGVQRHRQRQRSFELYRPQSKRSQYHGIQNYQRRVACGPRLYAFRSPALVRLWRPGKAQGGN